MSGFWNAYIILITLITLAVIVFLTIPALPGRQRDWPDDGTTGVTWDDDLKEKRNPTPEWWLALYYGTIFFAVLYLFIFGIGNFAGALGWSSEKHYQRQVAEAQARFGDIIEQFADTPLEEIIASEAALDIGANLYAENCAVCHGAEGRGGPGFPSLVDDAWLWGGKPQQILTSVLQGRQGMMPPQGPVLGDKVDAVVAYVRRLSGQSADAALAAEGEALFNSVCVACHGPGGKGNPLLGAPNLTDEAWVYGGSASAIRETLLKGRAGVMPAQADTLGEARSRIVAAYVYQLSRRGQSEGE